MRDEDGARWPRGLLVDGVAEYGPHGSRHAGDLHRGAPGQAAMGAMPNKTDRNDARGIAQIMRTGWYRAVHVKSPACRSWRALLAARRLVLNKMREVENGVRALLREA